MGGMGIGRGVKGRVEGRDGEWGGWNQCRN